MPYSIFFDGGYAIHGSYEIAHLGRPASHGCIRLRPQNAAILFALVKEHMRETTILVTGEAPTPSGGNGSGNIKRLSRQCPLWVKSGHMRCKRHVRFTPKADMCSALGDVCFGPIADITRHDRNVF